MSYFEWCATLDPGPPPEVEEDSPEFQEWLALWRVALAESNPALGRRISEEFCRTELGIMTWEEFARERLGIFPEDIDATEAVIDVDDWKRCADPNSKLVSRPTLAFDVSTDRKWSVIAAVGNSSSGGTHVEVIENRPRTGWVVNRLVELRDKHSPDAITCNPNGPAGGLLADCERVGLSITPVKGNDYTQACQAAYDDIAERRWRHLNQASLTAAATGAGKRTQGDAWVFDRRGLLDISPLTAVTLGAWIRRPELQEAGGWMVGFT